MTSYSPLDEIKKAIYEDNIEVFKKLMENIKELPFDIESHIIINKKNEFIKELFQMNKLTKKSKVLLGNTFNGQLKKILKVDAL